MNTNRTIRPATLEEIRALRENATKTGFPKSEVERSEDALPYTTHWIIEDSKNAQPFAGCSFKMDQHEGKVAWRLYAVTIHSFFLASFVGLAHEWPLIEEASKRLIAKHGVRMFWSNIQERILVDYKHQGWEPFGQPSNGTDNKGPYQKIIKFIGE